MKVVLYVDDDEDELLIFESACRLAHARFRLQTAHGSEEGLQYIEGRGRFADRLRFPPPDLLLLDVKMAGVDGFELLHRARARPDLARVPTVFFTSSVLPEDAERALGEGAVACVSKPIEMARTERLVVALDLGLDAPHTLPERLRAYGATRDPD